MAKVLLLDSTPIGQAPYLKIYTDVLDAHKVSWDILSWDKEQTGKTTAEDGIITIHRKMHLHGFAKLNDFYQVSKEMKRIISSQHYTHIIMVNTIWAFLLRSTLSSFKRRYILDIRDYKFEKEIIVRLQLSKLVTNSFCTVISSEGFRDFLPASDRIIVAHNISGEEHVVEEPSLYPGKRSVSIGYVGYIRYNESNRMMIQNLGGNTTYKLYYYGSVSKYCDFINDDSLKRNNVFMMGQFDNTEKYKIYKDIDMINSLFDLSYAAATLTPNRLYDALIYKKPIIVPAKTYMAELVEKHKIGLVMDLSGDFNKELAQYIESFDKEGFVDHCNQLWEMVQAQQKVYLAKIKEFIET